ncbi:MAG: helix-turn-helix domain-containing protein [Bacillota bacterium]
MNVTAGDLINTSTACKLFGISAKTIRRWCNDGYLPYYTTAGGHKRFSRKAIQEILEKNYVEANH